MMQDGNQPINETSFKALFSSHVTSTPSIQLQTYLNSTTQHINRAALLDIFEL
jgi:hypothetical protein